ncbi:anti-sigma factor family protein [Oceanibaculum sp.]|uniref:anti-sigma factor family protein n=1 Tax=Oceanibaculum sp. TaxID=1903597 RepID=UPI00258EF579|nr:hypothetical protein [Oceanibaculum sp.]MCH2394225.1 hypothetical protein [Oceanibaculum sp.]
METPIDRSISETDLHAYIDGGLEEERMRAVETYLDAHPEEAERVRAYALQRLEITRYLDAEMQVKPLRTERLSRRLSQALALRNARPWLMRSIAACLLVALGWGARDLAILPATAALPVFANEASEAHETVAEIDLPLSEVLRAEPMALVNYLARHDQADLPVRALSLDGLLVRGAQLVPWDEGTALQFVFEKADGGQRVTLFVAVPRKAAHLDPRPVTLKGVPMVYWQSGRMAFALSGDLPETVLNAYATHIEHETERRG